MWADVVVAVLGGFIAYLIIDISRYYIKQHKRKKKADDDEGFLKWL